MSLKIIFLAGAIIIAFATVGFGSTLNSVPSFNAIGGDNNVLVQIPEAEITKVILTESSEEITSATVTIKNTGVDSHAYKICAITKAGAQISATPGNNSDCTDTASIDSSSTGSAVISFDIPLNSSNVDYTDISIQQIS